jgi:endonuclease YncB( thermonuclease family)
MYEYKASLMSVHDGDTVTVDLDQGLREHRIMNIRFYGINAPELWTPEGKVSRDHLVSLLGADSGIALVIRTIKDAADKYGERWDGKVWLESAGTWGPDNQFVVSTPSLNDTMIADGFAVKYP